ncbi:hypothetical protein PQR75_04085 [Paraburkholderia fungorum]|uniref:hypothetical protein n=1 Tax=Paraburkholderia fungorum TaxID=134537 RepID=UPI0038BBB4E5
MTNEVGVATTYNEQHVMRVIVVGARRKKFTNTYFFGENRSHSIRRVRFGARSAAGRLTACEES